MPWTHPRYSRTAVDDAGNILLDPQSRYRKRQAAFNILNNWRASHSFPMRTMRYATERYCNKSCANGIVAQRLKRQTSIIAKLTRFKNMRLSQIQDIAGCRAIVDSIQEVYELQEAFTDSQIKHKLMGIDDYMQLPQRSGYRGVHLKYGYYSDRNAVFNSQRIEIQLRTRLQHTWATAVETVGTFRQQALKSSRGDDDWLRFFSLLGSICASRENTRLVPGTSEDLHELRQELTALATKTNVLVHLKAFGAALDLPDLEFAQDTQFFLLTLNSQEKRIKVQAFRRNELTKATTAYAKVETQSRQKTEIDAVLVSVDSLVDLKKAYPNYFLDTQDFKQLLENELAIRE